MLINYLKSLGLTILIILGGSIIYTLLEYYTNMTILVNILKVITTLLSIIIPTFLLGRKSLRKGYLEGLKYGIILVFISIIVSIISKNKIDINIIIYYIIIISSSMLGSMIGINFKNTK